MPPPDASLWNRTSFAGLSTRRFVADAWQRFAVHELHEASTIDAPADALRGRSVLISTHRQLPAVLALLQLDGLARRILLAPPDLSPAHLPAILAEAEVDAIVTDGAGPLSGQQPDRPVYSCGTVARPVREPFAPLLPTEWLLFTSGTTGRPKLVLHDLNSLAGPLNDGLAVAADAIWSTCYDVRRYGGLTILLRALLGGGSMVLSAADETVDGFLGRAGAAGVTHISGTPSHWRRVLMSGASALMSPRYVRLSGEVADQTILNQLAAAYPEAEVAHAFASTEAGFAFDVRDGLAGFPASLIDRTDDRVQLRVVDGSLRIRSARTAACYLGDHKPLRDAEGYVDTGDLVERQGDRYHFVGRREGVINVGGQKVHPEEVEAVINQHPAVQMARVRGRPSPILGTLVVADIVIQQPAARPFADLRQEILDTCRRTLPAYKVPAMLRDVPALEIAASGKLSRRHA